MTPTDEVLMQCAQTGDEVAFAQLVRRYEVPLFQYLYRLSGNAADAEDLFQETFLRVYKHRARFRRGSPFRPWVYQIATNACRDRLRWRKRKAEVSLDAPLHPAEPGGVTLGDALPSGGADPEAQARAAETAARLQQAVAGLSLKHRAVFLMARYEGLSYAEISGALRIPVGTVKSRMNKAVQHLMAELEEGGCG